MVARRNTGRNLEHRNRDPATRRRRSITSRTTLPDDGLYFIADHVQANVRGAKGRLSNCRLLRARFKPPRHHRRSRARSASRQAESPMMLAQPRSSRQVVCGFIASALRTKGSLDRRASINDAAQSCSLFRVVRCSCPQSAWTCKCGDRPGFWRTRPLTVITA